MSTSKKTFTLKHDGHTVGIFGNIKAAYQIAFCYTSAADRCFIVRYQEVVDGLKIDCQVSLSKHSLKGYTIHSMHLDTKCHLDFDKAMQEMKALQQEETKKATLAHMAKCRAQYPDCIISSL